MSTIVMAACWPLQGMSAAQKSVLISLADQANDDGVCWPSVATIAKRTCLSERSVQEAISWLQAVGAVFREYRVNSSTSYTVTPASYKPGAAPAKRKRSGADGAPGANSAPPAAGAPGADGAPPPADGAPGGADGAPQPPQEAHPTGAPGAPKSSLNRKRNQQRTAKEPFPPAAPPAPQGEGDDPETALQNACRATWTAYCTAFLARYGVLPVRNAPVNANVKSLVKRLGYEEAPLVAAWYVVHVNEAFVVKNSHGVGVLVASAEGYRTQWARGQAVTGTAAQATDKTSANADAIEEAKRLSRERAARRAKQNGEGGND